jgi:ubiquinone biosynthesis monooxygenase Coq7
VTRKPKPTPPGPAQNDRLGEMLRVDHAGETAAVGIYRGQRVVFSGLSHKQYLAEQFAHMQAEEQVHLDTFDQALRERGERPTAMIGLWQGLSFALGAGTALLGEKAAHACTEAVENVIEQHYQDQIDELDHTGTETPYRQTFVQFREEELVHRDSAVEQGARQAPGYTLLSAIVGAGCKLAIRISEKI